MNKLTMGLLIILCSTKVVIGQQNKHTPKHSDFVPNSETAIKVAEAIWSPMYGKKIYESQPFTARLKDSTVWVVSGTLNPEYTAGGTPYIEIRKNDCKILKVTHTK